MNDRRRSWRQTSLEEHDDARFASTRARRNDTVWKDPRGRRNQGYDTRAIQGDGDAEHCFNVKERM